LVQKSVSELRSQYRLSGFLPISLQLGLTVKICRVKLLSICCTLATRVRIRKVAVSRTGHPTHFIGSRCGPGKTLLVRVRSQETLASRAQMRKVAVSRRGPKAHLIGSLNKLGDTLLLLVRVWSHDTLARYMTRFF